MLDREDKHLEKLMGAIFEKEILKVLKNFVINQQGYMHFGFYMVSKMLNLQHYIVNQTPEELHTTLQLSYCYNNHTIIFSENIGFT